MAILAIVLVILAIIVLLWFFPIKKLELIIRAIRESGIPPSEIPKEPKKATPRRRARNK